RYGAEEFSHGLCGAGFIPASGVGATAWVWFPPPSAGMKPAPQGIGPAGSRTVADCTHFFCGAGFIPASGVGATAWVWFPPPSARIKPAPQDLVQAPGFPLRARTDKLASLFIA